MNNVAEVKDALAERLSRSSPADAEFLRKVTVKVTRLPTPFLRHGGIAKVLDESRRMPWPRYVFWAGSDAAAFLTGSGEQFAQLAKGAQVDLSTNELRIAYVQTMLRTTAHLGARHFLLSSGDEIPARRGLSEEDAARIASVRKRYQGSVLNPVVQPMPSAARVSIHALVGQDLVRFDVVLRPDGSFTADKVVLEKDLPMPYAL